MPIHPQEPDRAASDPGAQVPHGDGLRGDLPRPEPPRPDAADGGPGPDAAGPAPAEDAYTTAIQELEDRWRRALADLDNLRKRYARELAREREAERERVTTAFLPVLDNLDLALQHAGADPQSIVDGVRALREQALAIVAGLGFRREDQAGIPFDPTRHEVVGVVDSAASQVAPGAVAQVLRPGYGTPEHQLRPAAVTVAQRPES